MFYSFRTLTTHAGTGQHRSHGICCSLCCLLLFLVACHPMPRPGDPDRRLPRSFRSPEATFSTWMQATSQADRAALKKCLWSDMGRVEMDSWLNENMRPETRELFRDARWQGYQALSMVEVNFTFTTRNGDEFRGVMVRTADGWKIQRF